MKLLLQRLLSYFPSTLPVGMSEFETFSDSIIALIGQGFEGVSNDDLRFIIATIIMHLGPQRSAVPKNYFVRSIRKGAANQIASQVFQDIKARQAEATKVKAAEATAAAQHTPEVTPLTASDGTPKA